MIYFIIAIVLFVAFYLIMTHLNWIYPLNNETQQKKEEENGNSEVIFWYPPQASRLFSIEIKEIEELLKDQIEYHRENQSLAEEEVRYFIQSQRKRLRKDHPGGEVYAYGYIFKSDPLHVVYAPVNGGKIEPNNSGKTDILYFYDSQGSMLVYAVAPPDGRFSLQSMNGGYEWSKPRESNEIRSFSVVFGTDAVK